MKQSTLGTEKLNRLFIKFAIPSIIGMIFVGIQGIIDGLFVGNIIGEHALASVNLVQPFVQLIMAYALVISVGAQSVIGISLGKDDTRKAQNLFRTALISIITLSLIVTFAGTLFSNNIASFLGANDVLLEGSSIYIKIVASFSIFISLMFLFEMVVKTIGKPNISLISMVLSVFLNIILDYILIKEFNMGIKGAAIATGVSYVFALLINIVPFLNKNSIISIYNGSFNYKEILPMVYNGASEGVSSISTALSMLLFNTALIKLAGENGIAAFSIINYISQVGYMILFGIADGVRPIISYNYGSNNFDRVSKILKASTIINLLIGTIIFLLMSFFSKPLINIFLNDSTQILDIATTGARIYGLAFLFNGVNILLSSYFTAIDDPKSSIIIALSRGIIFIVIGILILPLFWGINGIWGSVVFAECITVAICIKLFKSTKASLSI